MSKRSVANWLSDIVSWGERLEDHLKGIDRHAFLPTSWYMTPHPNVPRPSEKPPEGSMISTPP
jgi:hypothetical protein